ncbi:flagellar hook protein FlgE [Rhodobacteraceae bacterium RKSG542]|uniref:flagellar hook protein FlgE n=1 Tax=Pseudovibrio flavus TaxID=2529854 RepID=UPI0012BB7694|nr:flagellar hook protein FlgE [Pseudovibrio flavus]MTI16768.1 flagellar hook protein FlgE [Pseudovibrio flavus]
MGLYGIMNTSVSGMNAQSNKLGTVADNIANVSTIGYKKVSTEFQSMVIGGSGGNYNSGSIKSITKQSVTTAGPYQFTTSGTDLAINGSGFFAVADQNGATYLTRAGSFVIDAKGDVVNSMGYGLQGVPLNGRDPEDVDSVAGLQTVNVDGVEMKASATTEGLLQVNLDSNAAVGAVETTSIVTYDNVGNKVEVTATYTKTAANEWEVEFTDGGGNTLTGGGTLEFDPANGTLVAPDPASLNVTIPNGQVTTFSIEGTTELASEFSALKVEANGNEPSSIDAIRIDESGILYAVYGNGEEEALYKLPLADVASPDNLQHVGSSLYAVTNSSGTINWGFPSTGGMGSMLSGALEGSNVDLASELTEMIQAQRTYSANSRVFSTSSELLQELVNLR